MLTLQSLEEHAQNLEEYARARQATTASRDERILADTLLRHAVGALNAIRKWKQREHNLMR